jgi:hypothetical protein
MHKAGSGTWAGALPEAAPGAALPVGRLFLEALMPVAPRRLVLLGDARGLQRDLALGKDELGAADVEIVQPVSRVEMPPRGGALPAPRAVLR